MEYTPRHAVAHYWLQYLSPLDAGLKTGLLQSEGIEVMLLDENIVWNNQMYAQAVGGVKLLVNPRTS